MVSISPAWNMGIGDLRCCCWGSGICVFVVVVVVVVVVVIVVVVIVCMDVFEGVFGCVSTSG